MLSSLIIKNIKSDIIESYKDGLISTIISKENKDDYILKVKLRDFTMRENIGYKCTDEEKINVALCYHNVITYLTEGNQWAMDSDRMNYLIENGYKIELFGSTFNTS